MRSEISDKLDALTVSLQETQDEGKLLKLTNKKYSPGYSQRFVVLCLFVDLTFKSNLNAS